jgi:hypothetical protein
MRQFLTILLIVALALLLPYSLKAQEHPDVGAPSCRTEINM